MLGLQRWGPWRCHQEAIRGINFPTHVLEGKAVHREVRPLPRGPSML